MHDQFGSRSLRILHRNDSRFGNDFSRITHLATCFTVEGCSIENQLDLLPRLGFLSQIAQTENADDGCRRFQAVIADELCWSLRELGIQLGSLPLRIGEAPHTGPTELSLPFQGSLEPGPIDSKARFASQFLGQFQWETIGIIKTEGLVTR